ncbi:MAG: aminotransferase class IV [Bacteroidetes bacterium]|nr:aminotransferase class IV [Bacteroidota bacterium]
MMADFVNYNGDVFPADQPVLMAGNRAFRYGDAVFETIRLMHGDILFFDSHLDRLKKSMQMLGMKWRDDFNFHNLYLLIRHLDQVNDLKGNGRIRMEVFRNDGGYYAPVSNEVSFLLEAEPLETKEYQLNETPLRIDVFSEISKPVNKLSNLKSSNALAHVMAGMYRSQSGLDDCILLNDEGRICEAVSSNIFLVAKDVVATPSLSEGCIAGVMRKQVIELLTERGKKIIQAPLTVDDAIKADEIFLTNVVSGIQWVGAFRQKRYFNSNSKWLLNELTGLQAKKI